MSFTELDRVAQELDWFEALLDVIRDGRVSEASDSILDAMRHLREYRRMLLEDDAPTNFGDLSAALFSLRTTKDVLKDRLTQYLDAERGLIEQRLRDGKSHQGNP